MEAIIDYKFLRFIPFCNLIQWDLKRYFTNLINSQYPVVLLGDYIKEEKQKYDISNKDCDYGILGVNNQVGIFDAYTENGSKINQKYKRMENGWIAYNPYRVNVGSIGLKKENYKNEYISPAYVVFSCHESLLPNFLFLLMKTPAFNQIIKDNTTGSVRQNLPYYILKTLQIPLPSFEEQNQLNSSYNQKLASAEELEKQATDLESGIEAYLMEELAVNISKTSIHNGLNFIPFSLITRWDVAFFTSTIRTKSKHKLATIGKCISYFMVDTNNISLRTETYKTPKQDFHYIGMESIEKSSGMLISLPLLKGSAIKSQTIQVPKDYFIYGKLRPYLNKYWINETENDNIVCSSEFFVFCIKTDINKLYFKYVLASSIVQQQISDATSGARMPRINESIFKNVEIPLPPLSIQNEIVNHISAEKEKIKNLKIDAQKLRKKALDEFEKVIFK